MKKEYMTLAIIEAQKAFSLNEVPVGVIIVKNDQIIASMHNSKKKDNNALAHAEILAIEKATKQLGDWRLNDCEMYVTLEPCPMCASAIQQSRISKVYIGTESNIKSNKMIMSAIFNNDEFNHKVEYTYLKDETCSKLLTTFFKNKR